MRHAVHVHECIRHALHAPECMRHALTPTPRHEERAQTRCPFISVNNTSARGQNLPRGKLFSPLCSYHIVVVQLDLYTHVWYTPQVVPHPKKFVISDNTGDCGKTIDRAASQVGSREGLERTSEAGNHGGVVGLCLRWTGDDIINSRYGTWTIWWGITDTR